MHSLHPVPLRLVLLLLATVLLFPSSGLCQSQAQSGEEFLEFQRTDKQRQPVQVRVGDEVKFPLQGEDGIYEEKGSVYSWTDSTIVVASESGGELYEVHWERTPYLKLIRRGWKVAAWIFLGIGILSFLVIIAIVAAAAAFGGTLALGLGLLVLIGFLFNPANWLFFGLGFLFLKKGSRKVDRFHWSWRRVRKVILRQSGS